MKALVSPLPPLVDRRAKKRKKEGKKNTISLAREPPARSRVVSISVMYHTYDGFE